MPKKWRSGEEYIDLGQEGSFEAMLDGKHIEVRRGLLTSEGDQRTLDLNGKDGAKTNSFHRTNELITVSYDRLVAVHSEGNNINFFPLLAFHSTIHCVNTHCHTSQFTVIG